MKGGEFKDRPMVSEDVSTNQYPIILKSIERALCDLLLLWIYEKKNTKLKKTLPPLELLFLYLNTIKSHSGDISREGLEDVRIGDG